MRAVIRIWEGLDEGHRALVAQVARYGVAGVSITLFQITVYNLLAGPAHWPPLVANAAGFLMTLLIGYTVHSRFTFQGHGTRGDAVRTGSRFLAANLLGFAINSWWVWSFVHLLGWKDWTPSLPMFFLTPFVLFYVNRRWVFG